MKLLIPLSFLLATGVWAQAPTPEQTAAMEAAAKAALEQGKPQQGAVPQAPAPQATMKQSVPIASVANLLTMPPDRVVATVDGEQVTAGDLQAILRTMSPATQQQALQNRRLFLEQYGVMKRLSAEAEKAKLDQQSPWKESLKNMRMQLLLQAEINRRMTEIEVPEEDQRKHYEANKDRYAQARVKAIYIPFSSEPVSKADEQGNKVLTEDEAKAKAESLLKQIREGADFVKLAKEHSGDPVSAAKDGDFGTIRKSDQIPEAVKTAVFGAKVGEVVGPVRQPSGFYLFRIEESGAPPFEQVRNNVANELRHLRFQEWLNSVQKSVEIKEEAIEVTMEVQQPSSPAQTPANK
ncbi:MAG TPA: peptidylprolyl isomerase [Bryobacteraceae bacterium]|nr:peptidylprolyl isomerase [Bryobacteraceae bacterium]HOQ45136.1 peptidylprolyl isomerase [Bryobacteraceae bacterium]HPQ15888.1 peptidylprolyl isomerase [Bryobacteraceae bacterium]HPU71208.1 peptidylprolyl isomerase [Bryobacteraceae bacterium]